MTQVAVARKRSRRLVDYGLALGLVVVSPLFAESLSGYDKSTGDPLALLGGLLILGPLYGCVALLIREIAVRFQVGWPGVLALATAFGLVQAGVIDQSLFSMSYREIEYWDDMLLPTLIEPLGFAPFMLLSFVGGHVIWSFGAPIALVGALDRRERTPWLRTPGLVVATLLYLGAAALILGSHMKTEKDHASAMQIGCTLAVALALVVGALTLGRGREARREFGVPSPWLFGGLSLVAGVVNNLLPSTWAGVAGSAALMAGVAAAVAFASRSTRWTGVHVVAVAGGAALAMGAAAFFVTPLGDVDPVRKYAHNVVFLLGTLALIGWSAWRSRKCRTPRG